MSLPKIGKNHIIFKDKISLRSIWLSKKDVCKLHVALIMFQHLQLTHFENPEHNVFVEFSPFIHNFNNQTGHKLFYGQTFLQRRQTEKAMKCNWARKHLSQAIYMTKKKKTCTRTWCMLFLSLLIILTDQIAYQLVNILCNFQVSVSQ